jgi:hypothetical protein
MLMKQRTVKNQTTGVFSCAVIFSLVIALTGCQYQDTETSSKGSDTQNISQNAVIAETQDVSQSDTVLPADIRESSEWDTVNGIIGLLGKPIHEIRKNEIITYYRFADGGEACLAIDNQVYLRFSGEVWADGSVCVAVGVPPRWLFPGDYGDNHTIGDIQVRFGIAPEYCTAGNDEYYYSYRFEDAEIRIFTKKDSNTLYDDGDMDKYVVIQMNGILPVTETGAAVPTKSINAKEVRQNPEWKQCDRYISHLGKTRGEIEALLGHGLDVSAEWDSGIDCTDTETGADYYFEFDSGRCTIIRTSPSAVLPYKGGVMTKEELFSYWKDVGYSHSYYEGISSYNFTFEDADVIIDLLPEDWEITWNIEETSMITIL